MAGNLLVGSFGLLVVFHILVLLRATPANIVWGGITEGGQANLVTLEVIALGVTLLFILIIAAKTGYIQAGKLLGVVNIGVWLVLVFLLLNMLGNLASGVSFENLIAAPITIILALCAFRLAIEK